MLLIGIMLTGSLIAQFIPPNPPPRIPTQICVTFHRVDGVVLGTPFNVYSAYNTSYNLPISTIPGGVPEDLWGVTISYTNPSYNHSKLSSTATAVVDRSIYDMQHVRDTYTLLGTNKYAPVTYTVTVKKPGTSCPDQVGTMVINIIKLPN